MKLNEALDISGIPLEEATLTQIIKRVNKHKGMVKSAEELARHLAGDNALRDSLSAVREATPEEQKQYSELMKDPMVAGAVANVPAQMKSGFDQLKKVGAPEEEPAEEPKAPNANALKQLDPKMKTKLSQMQKDWMAKKTASEKQALVSAWTKDPITARAYKFGLKQGVFAMPKVA